MITSTKDLEQYYSTPKYLAIRMAMQVPAEAKKILEPSAGTGALIDAIDKCRGGYDYWVYYCEVNKIRRASLKRARRAFSAGEDFLQYHTDEMYDCVIMNPPFHNAEDHFMKAYSLLRDGGKMICLVSEATLEGKTKKEQLMLNVIEDNNGAIERIEGAFTQKDALKKSKVVCSLITFIKNEDMDLGSVDFRSDMKDEVKLGLSLLSDHNSEEKSVAIYNYLESLVNNYNRSIEKNKAVVRAYYELSEVFPHEDALPYNPITGERDKLMPEIIHQGDFEARLRSACWRAVFNKTELANYMTTDMKKEFHEQQEMTASGKVDKNNPKNDVAAKEFTMDNISNLLMTLKRSLRLITNRALQDIFKWFTQYHKENRCHIEGWKTNSAWKVNRKIILPNILEYPMRGHHPHHINYNVRERLVDIEKALCLMLGMRLEDITPRVNQSTIELPFGYISESDFGVWHDSYFFKVKIYKKRTMHLVFKSDHVWGLFNQMVCDGQMWLGMQS